MAIFVQLVGHKDSSGQNCPYVDKNCQSSYSCSAGGYYCSVSGHEVFIWTKNGQGSYVLKMEPGAQTIPHVHMGFEEFLMIEGELIDSDGTVFKKGEFVSFEPGSQHSSFSETGALIVVFQRGLNEAINQD